MENKPKCFWKVETGICGNEIIGYSNGLRVRVAKIQDCTEAEARLMSAAPELLAACVKAEKALAVLLKNDTALDMLRAAIAKAEGRK